MRRPSFFLALSLSLTLAACSSGKGDDDDGAGDDDGGGGTIDAGDNEVIDASVGLTGIGQVCNPNPGASDCPADVPLCQRLEGSITAYCTMECGTFDQGVKVEDVPATAHQMCAAKYSGSATAACFVADGSVNDGMRKWYCGVICDNNPQGTLGQCDEPFECVQPNANANGFCLDPQ
jgi:hypothetical protein